MEEEDEKEKRFQLREQRQLLGRELAGVNLELQRVRAGVRGDQQGSTAGPQGPWAVDLQHGQGDAEAASNSSWDLVGHREDGSPPSVPAVLQVPAAPRLSGGASREALTLSWALDLALQGKMAQAADCLSQRLKSLEMIAGGASWAVSQRVEVVPPERGRLSSRAEAQEAAREEKQESKTRQMTKGKEKGKTDTGAGAWRPSGKGDQKGKDRGKGKKGSEKEESKRSS